MHRPSFGDMSTFLKMEDFSFDSVTSKIQKSIRYRQQRKPKLLFGETEFEQNGVNLDYTK